MDITRPKFLTATLVLCGVSGDSTRDEGHPLVSKDSDRYCHFENIDLLTDLLDKTLRHIKLNGGLQLNPQAENVHDIQKNRGAFIMVSVVPNERCFGDALSSPPSVQVTVPCPSRIDPGSGPSGCSLWVSPLVNAAACCQGQ